MKMAKPKLTEIQKAIVGSFPPECNVGTGKNARHGHLTPGAKRSIKSLVDRHFLMEIERPDGTVGYCLTTLGMKTRKELNVANK